MAIVPLKKMTLFGPLTEKKSVVEMVQDFGHMHIIPLSPSEHELPERPKDYYNALKYLADCPEKRPPYKYHRDFNPSEIVDKALMVKRRMRDVEEELHGLEEYLKIAEPWGSFDMPHEDDLNGRQFYFYKVPGFKRRKLKKLRNITWVEVHTSNRNAYIVVIAKKEPSAKKILGERVHLRDISLEDARVRAQDLAIELDELTIERSRLTRCLPSMIRFLAQYEDKTLKDYVSDRTLDADDFFALQGWVPIEHVAELEELAQSKNLAVTTENPSDTDTPPTLMKNSSITNPGEDLIAFYQMPGYRAWDPSGILLFSFAIFFAMILADAGYAAIIGLITLFTWRRNGKSETGRRIRWMMALLSIVSLVFGVLVGSYFGAMPEQFPILNKAHIFDMTDFNAMMKLSIIVGVIHIVLANLVITWKKRWSLSMFGPFGWALIMMGGFSLYHFGHTTQWAQILTGIGGAMVVFLTSDRPLRGVKNLALRLADGLLSAANVSKAFGDTLSYLRLFALGLASASLAAMFNQMAGQIADGVAGIGFFLAILVLILGHGLNLVLGIMGGVVHGLRLNLIEFFSWSISDEGSAFIPFNRKEKALWNNS